MNWIPAFAGMTDEEKINRGFRDIERHTIFLKFCSLRNESTYK
jgi:hypothetical protein